MPSELRLLDLFSGIGGFSYAAEVLVGGFKTVGFCDIEPFAQELLRKRWPQVPVYRDVRELTGRLGEVDVITAGFPCQDLSTAGKRLGFAGDRSVLFYEVIRLAREFRPQFLLLENVRGLLSHANGETFQEVLYQIACAGFDAEWAVVSAASVGACHRRERVWVVAYASNLLCDGSPGEQQRKLRGESVSQSRNSSGEASSDSNNKGSQGRQPAVMCQHTSERIAWQSHTQSCGLSSDWRSYVSQPVICRGDDGFPGRVDRLKALGNSVVPQAAAVPLQRIKNLHYAGCCIGAA